MLTRSQKTVLRALLNEHNVDEYDSRAVKAFFDYTDRGISSRPFETTHKDGPCLQDLLDWEKQAFEIFSKHCFRAFDEKLWSGQEGNRRDTCIFVEDLAHDQPEFVLQVARAVATRYGGFLGRHWEALLHLWGIYRMPDGSLQIVSS